MSSFILHMCVCTSALMHTWGQRELSGVSPFTRWVQRSNSGHQAWQQLPLPSEPSYWPIPILFENGGAEIPTTEQLIIQVQPILVKFYFGNIPFVRAKHKGSITNT